MSKSSERQAWTKFVEEREAEKKPKRPHKEASQPELEAGLDDLIDRSVSKILGRRDAFRSPVAFLMARDFCNRYFNTTFSRFRCDGLKTQVRRLWSENLTRASSWGVGVESTMARIVSKLSISTERTVRSGETQTYVVDSICSPEPFDTLGAGARLGNSEIASHQVSLPQLYLPLIRGDDHRDAQEGRGRLERVGS